MNLNAISQPQSDFANTIYTSNYPNLGFYTFIKSEE
jgi:hypothetical protein